MIVVISRISVLKILVIHRMAAAGRALPLLMVCETALGRRNFRAAAGTLPMLTTTLEQVLTGLVTGGVTMWSRDGVPAALHCR